MKFEYLIIFFVFLIIILFYLIKKWQEGKLSKFLPVFYEGKIKSNFIFYPKISGFYNSIYSEVIFYPQSKNSPAKVKFIMDFRENERWRIKRKVAYDLDFSLLQKIEIEDNFFDDFIIRAKGEEFIRPIISNQKKKETIKKLFEKKESQLLEAKKGKLIFWLSNKTISNLQMEDMEEILKNLLNLTL